MPNDIVESLALCIVHKRHAGVMEYFLFALVGIVSLASLLSGYIGSKDPLNPNFILAPLFLYSYSLEPLLLGPDVAQWIRSYDQRLFVGSVNVLAVLGLFGGLRLTNIRIAREPHGLISGVRDGQLISVARGLLLVALAGFVSGIWAKGGFIAAYSGAKGGGRFASGYLGESVHLGLVASLVIGATYYRRGLSAGGWAIAVLGVVPNLVQGTLGGRRGPIYLSLMTLVLVWFLSSRRRPGALKLGCLFGCVLVAVLFVQSQRQHLYLGSQNATVDWERFVDSLLGTSGGRGSNFIYGSGFIAVCWETGRYTYGKELIVNLLVRPIPRQLWPSKYENVGWEAGRPGFGHFSDSEWMQSVGWLPMGGASSGCVSDLFGEFGLGVVVAMFALGYGMGELRTRSLLRGGVWQFLYLEALVLSIYLATQSFSAFYHRWLVLAVPTIVLFRHIDKRGSTRRVGVGRRKPLPS